MRVCRTTISTYKKETDATCASQKKQHTYSIYLFVSNIYFQLVSFADLQYQLTVYKLRHERFQNHVHRKAKLFTVCLEIV